VDHQHTAQRPCIAKRPKDPAAITNSQLLNARSNRRHRPGYTLLQIEDCFADRLAYFGRKRPDRDDGRWVKDRGFYLVNASYLRHSDKN
jgi:hypothetical protein